MYIGVLSGCEDDLVLFVSKKYNDVISGVEVVAKEDLDLVGGQGWGLCCYGFKR